MSDSRKTNGSPPHSEVEAEERPIRPAAEAEVPTDTGGDENPADQQKAEAVAEDSAVRTAVLESEIEATKEKFLRAMADLENLRRRAEREKAQASQYAITGFARDMLAVADNFARALASMPQESRAAAEETVRNLIAGIEMTEREMHRVFERHGIRMFDPVGERFDPNLHQAMFEVEDPQSASGTVVQVMQTGYMIGDRVLRPALVGVSKGGPRSTAKVGALSENDGESAGITDPESKLP